MSRWITKHSGFSRFRTLLATMSALTTVACSSRTETYPQFATKSAPMAVLASATYDSDGGLKGRPDDKAEATRAYLESLSWADTVKYASADFTVRAGNDSARIRVVPMMTANEVSWQESMGIGMPGGNGHFVARIYNLDKKNIPALGMMADDTGYVWVGERKLANRGAAVYVLSEKGNPLRHKHLKVVGYCGNGQHPGPKVRSTDGSDCQGGLGTHASIAQLAAARPIITAGGLWISCKGGCCEVAI